MVGPSFFVPSEQDVAKSIAVDAQAIDNIEELFSSLEQKLETAPEELEAEEDSTEGSDEDEEGSGEQSGDDDEQSGEGSGDDGEESAEQSGEEEENIAEQSGEAGDDTADQSDQLAGDSAQQSDQAAPSPETSQAQLPRPAHVSIMDDHIPSDDEDDDLDQAMRGTNINDAPPLDPESQAEMDLDPDAGSFISIVVYIVY